MLGGEGVGTARGIPTLFPLFSRPPLLPLLPLQRRNARIVKLKAGNSELTLNTLSPENYNENPSLN